MTERQLEVAGVPSGRGLQGDAKRRASSNPSTAASMTVPSGSSTVTVPPTPATTGGKVPPVVVLEPLPSHVEPDGPVDEAGVASPPRGRPGVAEQLRSPGAVLRLLGTVAGAVALLLAGFGAYLFGFTPVEALHAQHHLADELDGAAGLAALNGRVPPEGAAVGILRIPALGLRQILVEGTSAKDLEAGPGVMVGSAPPGTRSDVVVAGRRATFGAPFAHLARLSAGDEIEVTAALGTFTYRVTGSDLVASGHDLRLGRSDEGRLLLVTAGSVFGGGGLFVVTAALTSRAVASVAAGSSAQPPPNFGLSGDSGAVAPAILWGEALIAVLVIAWYVARRSAKGWLVYALSAPVVIALALVCFVNVAALLPATV